MNKRKFLIPVWLLLTIFSLFLGAGRVRAESQPSRQPQKNYDAEAIKQRRAERLKLIEERKAIVAKQSENKQKIAEAAKQSKAQREEAVAASQESAPDTISCDTKISDSADNTKGGANE